MRPPRFRVRTIMIAVAVLAVLMGGVHWAMKMRRLSLRYRELAEYHHRQSINLRPVRILSFSPTVTVPLPSAYCDRQAALARKFFHAASYPWLPVEPDSPPE